MFTIVNIREIRVDSFRLVWLAGFESSREFSEKFESGFESGQKTSFSSRVELRAKPDSTRLDSSASLLFDMLVEIKLTTQNLLVAVYLAQTLNFFLRKKPHASSLSIAKKGGSALCHLFSHLRSYFFFFYCILVVKEQPKYTISLNFFFFFCTKTSSVALKIIRSHYTNDWFHQNCPPYSRFLYSALVPSSYINVGLLSKPTHAPFPPTENFIPCFLIMRFRSKPLEKNRTFYFISQGEKIPENNREEEQRGGEIHFSDS